MDWRHLISLLLWLTGAQASVIHTNVSRGTRQLFLPQAIRPVSRDPYLPTSYLCGLGLHETTSVDVRTSNSNDWQASTAAGQFLDLSVAVRVATITEPSATHQVLPTPSGIRPHTTGTVFSELNTSGKSTKSRLLSSSTPTPATLLGPTGTTTSITTRSIAPTMASQDIFAAPIDTKAPPLGIAVRHDHPVPRKGIQSQAPLQTNKFYSNFFLGDQLGPTYTFPYSVQWAGGKGVSSSWGISCSHIDAHQRVLGPEKHNGAASFFLNPVGIQSMVISAKELGVGTTLSTDSITAFSARVCLSKDSTSPPAISFPLVQGMAYITAQFDGATPVLQSGVYFKTMSRITRDPKDHVVKYTFILEDGTTWRVYAWRTKGDELDLKVINNGVAESKKPFYGIVQVCKDPGSPGSEGVLDDGAGIYPVTLTLSGSASGPKGTYSFKFQKEGNQSGHLYMYALPHHVQSFNDETKQRIQKVQLQSTTKGLATLVRGADWTMVEPNMPVDMDFSPWHPEKGSIAHLSDYAKSNIRAAAAKELSQNMIAQSNVDSMYFSGKALAKFATIVYVINNMVGDEALAQTGLGQLKAAFGIFAANKQRYPLTYESKSRRCRCVSHVLTDEAAWGGVVSSASYVTGDAGVDFGNTYYNDHHFHYGYHILAAATIGHVDPDFVQANMDYVNTLVRDIANPSSKDKFFPQWRNFDWYHGHSWAHGLYAAMDGKVAHRWLEMSRHQANTQQDQESSSEDVMHAYALKMWGQVSGNADLQARGDLQLAIISRSLQQYYLYQDNNQVQPKQFIGNKVAGILFENKIDHTTYFDPHIEAIQGIHMIPILPPTPFVRVRSFVKEEWEAYFSNGRIDNIRNAWNGIIIANYATVDPKMAWECFTSRTLDPQLLDGGASLTWFMAYAAALGGI
ncbi:endo-1,3(4)-beta-glucanase 2 [Tolypocladium capitatum]|uniref:glucan endo-1,3-beta-D-glucosidase n=1 Tax=Tolypocladium capitatum TaxID=45235 RepID=A0A2K3Q747_9HYPO|nr:endo-1,3(4)-beta-glucanase 2 [Tolypocladium capitatum]